MQGDWLDAIEWRDKHKSLSRKENVCGKDILSVGNKMSRLNMIVQNQRRHRVRLFRNDNLDAPFSPQYVDTDILFMTFNREVNFGLSNPEILDLNVFKERRQDRL